MSLRCRFGLHKWRRVEIRSTGPYAIDICPRCHKEKLVKL